MESNPGKPDNEQDHNGVRRLSFWGYSQMLDPTDEPNGHQPDNHHSDPTDTKSDTDDFKDMFKSELPPEPEQFSIWSGWEGAFIMGLGVVLPTLLIVSASVGLHERIVLLLLKQPIETLIEIALILTIPIANLDTWQAFSKSDYRASVRRGVLNGVAIGASAATFLVSIVAVLLRYPTVSSDGTRHGFEFFVIALVSLFACCASILVTRKVMATRILKSSRNRAISYVVFGAMLVFAAFAGAEARGICIRIAAQMALSENRGDREKGLQYLRMLTPERELKMECSNSSAGGLPGLFARLDTNSLRQLYFAATGQPFRDERAVNYSSMSDDYLKRHVVGAPVDGLTLFRSAMQGHVNPRTVSSTIYWTFVFDNKTYEDQEARAQLEIPQGAVVSGMTVWKDGQAQKTIFRNNDNNQPSIGHEAPGIITDLGQGRVLLHCYPVKPQGQLKVALVVTTPLKLHTLTECTLPLPKFVNTNFSIKQDGEHELRVIADEKLSLSAKGIKAGQSAAGYYTLAGRLPTDTMSGAGISLRVNRPATKGPIALLDNNVNPHRYLVQTIKELPASPPKHLVVVMDGSETLKPYVNDLMKVLKNTAQHVPTSIVVASNEKDHAPEAIPLTTAIKSIKSDAFVGGQDNLHAIVKATELAGESGDGAVIWIHGPQPSFNKEIYIVSPFATSPAMFELSLDKGSMDASEYFKNHREIGTLTQISRNASPAEDLDRFLAKWQPGGHEFVVEYRAYDAPPKHKMGVTVESQEISALFAKEQVVSLLNKGQSDKAVRVAVSHRIVSPVSIAVTVASGNNTNQSLLTSNNQSVQIFDSSTGLDDSKTVENPSTSANAARADAFAPEAGVIPPANVVAGEAGHGGSTPFVTPLPNSSNNGSMGQADETRAQVLQGATNGTIGPQGCDATSVMGVNTAGTVRVNNLANLEAMLNIFVNTFEILCILSGATLLVAGLKPRPGQEQRRSFAYAMTGIALIVSGIAAPGMVNYMLASARDANLFS